MTDRSALIDAFLAAQGWDDAQRAPLAGDASNRRYERLAHPDGRFAVLMDAPPEKGEDTRPFTSLARHLSAQKLSAPAIFGEDAAQGFLLIEDLGDDLFSRVVTSDTAQELPLYLAATDTLIALHQAPLPNVPDYGPETMTKVAGLAPDWYAFGATGAVPATRETLLSALRAAFDALAPWTPVLVLRDYHAENLLWLPNRPAAANVGLLDFQDAGIGHPAYDLMSLARDARRDVSAATAQAMIDHYVTRTGRNADAFAQAAATVSAQRNLRILGVFARLSMHFGKPHYVDLIPRVWGNLMADLAHPALGDLAKAVHATLPEPTPEVLTTLKAKCATIPTL